MRHNLGFSYQLGTLLSGAGCANSQEFFFAFLVLLQAFDYKLKNIDEKLLRPIGTNRNMYGCELCPIHRFSFFITKPERVVFRHNASHTAVLFIRASKMGYTPPSPQCTN